MNGNAEKKGVRAAYRKPELRAVNLAAEEVLVGGCKTASDKASGSLVIPCNAASCSGIGS